MLFYHKKLIEKCVGENNIQGCTSDTFVVVFELFEELIQALRLRGT